VVCEMLDPSYSWGFELFSNRFMFLDGISINFETRHTL
jgi:hypothetical protein